MMPYLERPITAHNTWLTQPLVGRGGLIAGVMLHSTRSGVSDGDDGPRTERWWSNPQNNQGGWGSYADVLIYEDGTRVICTDFDNEYATWAAGRGSLGTWAAGVYYIQIEIAQGNAGDPFTDAQIESLAELTARLAARYSFPIERIPFLDQTGVPPRGICTHEDSATGRIYGKTDPGPMFPWERFLSMAIIGGAAMTDDERTLLNALAASVARLERLVTANGYESSGTLLTGEDALAAADADGISLREGLRLTQESLTFHTQNHPAGSPGALPKHYHDLFPIRTAEAGS